MNFEIYPPSGLLKDHIENFWVVKTREQSSIAVFPEPRIVLSFRIMGAHSYLTENIQKNLSALAITGLRNSVKHTLLSADTETILIKFKPCKARSFFEIPLHLFSNQSVSVFDFMPRQVVSDFEEKLAAASGIHMKIEIIEDFLLSLLKNKNGYSFDLMDFAVQKIILSSGTIRIEKLASMLNLSLDNFEKRFRDIVGTSPKKFSSMLRLTSLIKRKRDNQSLTEIAYEYGYFDQSHFIKDFKKFTGETPLSYFRGN